MARLGVASEQRQPSDGASNSAYHYSFDDHNSNGLSGEDNHAGYRNGSHESPYVASHTISHPGHRGYHQHSSAMPRGDNNHVTAHPTSRLLAAKGCEGPPGYSQPPHPLATPSHHQSSDQYEHSTKSAPFNIPTSAARDNMEAPAPHDNMRSYYNNNSYGSGLEYHNAAIQRYNDRSGEYDGPAGGASPYTRSLHYARHFYHGDHHIDGERAAMHMGPRPHTSMEWAGAASAPPNTYSTGPADLMDKHGDPHVTARRIRGALRQDWHQNEERVCQNCGVRETTLWRRSSLQAPMPGSKGHLVCNACGTYERLHNKPRPVSLAKRTQVIRKRQRHRPVAKPDQSDNVEASPHSFTSV